MLKFHVIKIIVLFHTIQQIKLLRIQFRIVHAYQHIGGISHASQFVYVSQLSESIM